MIKDVHTEHCCILHGCKYWDEDCTVVTRVAPQSYACEECYDDENGLIMKPEEMRDDIPMDVRQAISGAMTVGTLGSRFPRLVDTIRAKPRTVHLCEADLPAPLEEVPEDRVVWSIDALDLGGVRRIYGEAQYRAIALCLAFATQEEAEAWLAHLQSWRNPRPGDDWTPHTPGDPMPCAPDARVDVRFEGVDVRFEGTREVTEYNVRAASYLWTALSITAWRYAREGEE